MKIGFIGQGYIGKNYADDFEERGFDVIRFAKEEPFLKNRDKIKECDIVFVAVPTPTTPRGFDYSIIESVLPLIGDGKTAVIKSTVLPGITEVLQNKFSEIILLNSPEFLTEVNAPKDAKNPNRNIIGIPVEDEIHRRQAELVMSILPEAPFKKICRSREAELVKYAGNNLLYIKVIFANILHDLAEELGVDWKTVRDSIAADPRIGGSHLDPVHKSGRGAGGNCFIKDFAAFRNLYAQKVPDDKKGHEVLEKIESKNIELLKFSGKDLDLLGGVYGTDFLKN